MSIKSKVALLVIGLIMIFSISIQYLLFFDIIQYTTKIGISLFLLFLSLILSFKILLFKLKSVKLFSNYTKNLNLCLISLTRNDIFFKGNLDESSKELTKVVTESICVDRCSIWLYNKDKTSIICQNLYINLERKWYQNIELFKNDYERYFNHLNIDPIIIANDASIHPATSCFLDTYLKPLGIKSMLDVPIYYKGNIIGVICIESLKKREWLDSEINFAQLLSSIYSFSYSVKETNRLNRDILEFENFVDTSVLVSKADYNGKITYVNENFTRVSGYSLNEVIGKDHNIVNSGYHTRDFWNNMYKTVLIDRKIWNEVCTNKRKDGTLYYVDSYIKADFDEYGKLKGFMSIRYDISEIVNKTNEIERKNSYLEHASKILRHDMHSGINTYIPRGISSLERRLSEEQVKDLKIEAPLKMIKEGLKHSQKVYRGVYEFTNLVKKDVFLNKTMCDLSNILKDYLSTTAYLNQVNIEDLGEFEVNEPLFCTALDNLIRNGLKYNDSNSKLVKIYRIEDTLFVEDNGRGMSQKEFDVLKNPYTRKEGQKESGSGLGLNICIAILEEHNFSITCDKMDKGGTQLKIKLNR